MQEESKNTPDTDPSGLFSTYKTHPIENEGENMHNQDDKPSPPIQNSQKGDKNKDGALRIIIDGCVRITQTAVWSIAVFGGLFIAALATNTMDRAVSIINANIGTHIILSGEVAVKEDISPDKKPLTQGLTSNAISQQPATTTNNTPDALANKRRAVLEARKAAKLLEEKQKAAEQGL